MHVLTELFTILRRPHYGALALVTAFIVFTGAVWLPNSALIKTVVFSTASFMEKVFFLFSLYSSIESNFTIVSAGYTIVIAILFGIQISLLSYYIKVVRNNPNVGSVSSLSVGGLISGVFGIGCAACGTFILTSVLALFSAGWIVAYLPFDGEEFGILGVALLGYSIVLLLRKIRSPFVC